MRPAVIQNTLNKKTKIGIIMLIIVMIACTVLFSVLFINCFRFYSEFDIGYDELFYEELTFDKYAIIYQHKGADIYEIYFQEYPEPFIFSNIVTPEIDKNAIAGLKPGEKADVYYRDTSNRNYNYSICEMTCGASQILSLQEYVEKNQNNQTFGMFFCPIAILCGLAVSWYLSLWLTDTGLGRLKIQYQFNGNDIRIYRSVKGCFLVINGNVVDRYYQGEIRKVALKGNFKFEGKRIIVSADIKSCKLKLYCNGECVATKFMLNPRYW